MSAEDDVKTILAADATLSALLTGGVLTFDETGRQGLSRGGTPAVFDATTGLLMPCAVVKARARMADGAIVDEAGQETSTRQVVEVWVYQDGDAGYSAIDTALARVYTLLHAKHVGDAAVLWAGNTVVRERDPALENASVGRGDYALHAIQT